jgi:thioredoxin
MKSILFSMIVWSTVLIGCSNGQNSQTNLSATEFAEKIKAMPQAPIIDVRTPEEFEKGHLINSKNIDWNNSNFEEGISKLDKSKPVFVYCLSGGRSSSAASKMRQDGFKQVYELNGGIMKWRAANLPETTEASTISSGMSKQQFEQLLVSDKLILVDFYADWCAPCKKMKPYLDEISKDMADKVTVIRINADDNQALCKELNIDALPVLMLYKNKALTWENKGFIEKTDVVKHLN